MKRVLSALSILMTLFVISGCNDAEQDVLNGLRSRLIVAEQPTKIRSLADVHASGGPDEVVTVAGRIFALEMSPFDQETAAFNIIELPKPGHGHEDPGDCPFCRRELENAPAAVVQILDESGEVIAKPADQLLQLEKNQDVVVQGKATKVGEVLVISAESIHLLAETAAADLAAELNPVTPTNEPVDGLDTVPEPPPFPTS